MAATLWSYTRTRRAQVSEGAIVRPVGADTAQRLAWIASALEAASTNGGPERLRYVIRAGANGFQGQSLPPHATRPQDAAQSADPTVRVLDLSALGENKIKPVVADAHGATVEVDGWTNFGRVFDAVTADGARWLPYVVPTSRRITVAGAIAANAVGRTSSRVGRFSNGIVWFRFLRPSDGATVQVFHPREEIAGAPAGVETLPRGENDRVFAGFQGGCGLLGVVTRVCLRLMPLLPEADRARTPEIVATTTGGRSWGFDRLVGEHVTASCAVLQRDARGDPMLAPWRSQDTLPLSFLVINGRLDREKGFHVELGLRAQSRAPRPVQGARLWRRKASRNAFLALMRFMPALGIGFVGSITDGLLLDSLRPLSRRTALDPLCSWTFFFEAHSMARDVRERNGRHPESLQVSFAFPVVRHENGSADAPGAAAFLRQARRRLRNGERCFVQAVDLLTVPAGPCILSPDKGRDVLLVSFALEAVEAYRRPHTAPNLTRDPESRFEVLARDAARLGGAVHLGKNHPEAPEVLRATFGSALGDFLDLKRALDPGGVLVSHTLAVLEWAVARVDGKALPDLDPLPEHDDVDGYEGPDCTAWDDVADESPDDIRARALGISPEQLPKRLVRTGGAPTGDASPDDEPAHDVFETAHASLLDLLDEVDEMIPVAQPEKHGIGPARHSGKVPSPWPPQVYGGCEGDP